MHLLVPALQYHTYELQSQDAETDHHERHHRGESLGLFGLSDKLENVRL